MAAAWALEPESFVILDLVGFADRTVLTGETRLAGRPPLRDGMTLALISHLPRGRYLHFNIIDRNRRPIWAVCAILHRSLVGNSGFADPPPFQFGNDYTQKLLMSNREHTRQCLRPVNGEFQLERNGRDSRGLKFTDKKVN